MSKKIRLDVLVTERGLCESRQKAQATIMAGRTSPEHRWRRTPMWRYGATPCGM